MADYSISLPATDRESILKCVVWDLDDTLWEGALLEGGGATLRPGVLEAVRTLDSRGTLQSIASKNDHQVAWPVLERFGLAEYFLYPCICWSSKAKSVQMIGESLGIALDSIAFIDDQAIERDEVQFYAPQITVFSADQISSLLSDPRLQPGSITMDGRCRRLIYQADIRRSEAENTIGSTRDEFLSTLNMQMEVHRAKQGDLARAEELTLRTNQLNTTGLTYSQHELDRLAGSSDHLVLVAKLSDRYGSSGTIGLAVVETEHGQWTIRLLIMSCRVITRGVGSSLLAHITHAAASRGVRLRAAFVHTDRNRKMYVSYKFAGFRECGKMANTIMLEHDYVRMPSQPSYVTVVSDL